LLQSFRSKGIWYWKKNAYNKVRPNNKPNYQKRHRRKARATPDAAYLPLQMVAG